MIHLPMRACRSLSQREGGASGTGVEDEKGRREMGCCARGRARKVRRARGNMVRIGGGGVTKEKQEQEKSKSKNS